MPTNTEQEELITKLETQNDTRNAQIRLAFVVLPLLLIAPCAYFLLSIAPPTLFRTSVLYVLLGTTSLGSSAYMVAYIRIASSKQSDAHESIDSSTGGPVEHYLELLNGGICAILLYAAFVLWMRSDTGDGVGSWAAVLCVPGAMFGIVLLVRREMASVDVEELKELRYGYKGA